MIIAHCLLRVILPLHVLLFIHNSKLSSHMLENNRTETGNARVITQLVTFCNYLLPQLPILASSTEGFIGLWRNDLVPYI